MPGCSYNKTKKLSSIAFSSIDDSKIDACLCSMFTHFIAKFCGHGCIKLAVFTFKPTIWEFCIEELYSDT